MAIRRVFVAGAGLMGHGIAQVHAAIGLDVALYEPELARAVAGRDRIAANLERAVAKGRLSAADRDAQLAQVRPTDRLDAAADADLVVEAVFEDPAVKTRLWAELDGRAPAGALFATNTSSISIDELAAAVAEERRGGVRGHALLQPGAGDAAHRAHPRQRDLGRDRDDHPRAGRGDGQAGHRVGRPAGLHRESDPDAATG